jgi:cell division protein FtsW (lipid II flippase)
MLLFLGTALALLALLVVLPFWAGTGWEEVPMILVTVLTAGVVIAALAGRPPRD